VKALEADPHVASVASPLSPRARRRSSDALLVPAVLVLMGKGAWWFPGWLERWLPRLNVEGDEYFTERDAVPAAGAR